MWSVSTVLRHLLVAKGTEKPMGVYLKNGESILDAALDLMDILQPLSIAILGESNGLKEGKLPNAADVLGDGSDNSTDNIAHDVSDDYAILSTSATRDVLTDLHPSPLNIFKLWQAFLENVNPLTKIIHAPTVQQQILDAMSDLGKVSREIEALMFAIYCIALVSLQAEDVEKSFGESKKALLSKCRRGAQLAFKNASLLRTSSSVVLQAFMLYLLCMRSFSDPHTIWTLCGIAVRIAQRIGIHRDGSAYGLSVFETEMRRRIWFQLVIIDATSAQFCGVASTPLPATIDVQPPMNANDSDLDPRMTEPACEKPGPTEMMFVLARSAFGKWLLRLSNQVESSNNGPWAFLSSSSMSLKDKDKTIDELEAHMEDKFLRHCDKSLPLHMATAMMARSAIYYTRLMAHHPRQYQDPNTRIPQPEKDVIFENSLKMTEYADYAQNNPIVRKYSWHMVNHMPWDAIIFMLSEMRHRTDSEEKSKVWQLIGNVYSGHIKSMNKNGPTPLHMAIQNLIVKAWKTYIEECNLNDRTPTPCPTIVASLLANAEGISSPQHEDENFTTGERVTRLQDQPRHDRSSSQLGLEAENFGFLLGDSPQDWNEWDNLLSNFQGSFTDDATYLS
ncbi:Transcription factor, fungi [Penicillium expansum]|uniref:Transcription factor, fungi n=1 Tax=Penicillium expansum TaxID=27334 RepID=A0A0A2J1M5_PENEN|nr:Transcription factor, fungi [Penicillium expansum]KGO40537.1 Transcription factor, fungi [Penicillium expansum]KGO48598.1 Transcription factor, fungi [Penicillium expansum]KGO55354.1 Transcription factor, fungi [Penicillium expansum]